MKLTRNNRLSDEQLAVDESIFSLTNGTLGVRGVFAEGYGNAERYVTMMNGFYDYYDYRYEEYMPGFPKKGQKLVLLPNGTKINIRINGVNLNKKNAILTNLTQSLDMETGLLERIAIYRFDNYRFSIKEERIVPLSESNVIAQKITIETDSYEGEIIIDSFLSMPTKTKLISGDPRLQSNEDVSLILDVVNPLTGTMQLHTAYSNQLLHSRIVHKEDLQFHVGNQKLWGRKVTKIDKNNPVVFEKYTIHLSSEHNDDIANKIEVLTDKMRVKTFYQLIEDERKVLKEFWSNFSLSISSNKEYELLLKYNIFQLYRHGPKNPFVSIAAKGLTGEGYEGHYFWDTEIYMLPFFITQKPSIARNLLLYRYYNLQQGKEEARSLGINKGAKIPWRTINGFEASPYFLAGSAQYHINSDIAYATLFYFDATLDLQFLADYGFEIIVETARFLADQVVLVNGIYHLNAVTGPDEYTTLVDDNYYTNRMLKYHFERLVSLYHQYYNNLQSVINKLNVTANEILEFMRIAEKINLPFDRKRNIVAQDASFLTKKRLDLHKIPKEKFPLLLNYHPLFLTSHQILKQADALLAMMLLEHDKEIVKSSFNYYEPITTHDSSLSKCVHSILAFELHKDDLALPYFKEVLETDLKDVHQNTKDGLHMANLGGSYMNFMYGVVGLRITEDYVRLFPRVLDDISNYAVSFMYRGHSVNVTVDKKVTINTKKTVKILLYEKFILVNSKYVTDIPNIV